MGMDKRFSDSIDTACVSKKGIDTELLINEAFWKGLSDTDEMAVLLHEVLHITLMHLFMMGEYSDHTRFNYAADCAVNSYIPELQTDPWVYPQKFKLPLNKSLKWYYDNLPQDVNQNNPQYGTGPNHSWGGFSEGSDSEKQLAKNQINYQMKNVAEELMKRGMAGSIPGELKDYIDELLKGKPPVFNWKSYFRRLIGASIEAELTSTRYKESKRFKDARGLKLKTKPNILVAVDTSGSIGKGDLQEFFTEIHHVYRSGVNVDVAQFDTKITSITPYKGSAHNIAITGRGGTDIHSTVDYYNSTKKYSSMIVFTDGELDVKVKANNLIWVIARGGSRQSYPGKVVYIPENN